MILIFNLIGAALLGLFAAYIIKNKSHAKRINHYFCNAVRVYALTSEEDARIAILTAATVATKKQRESMVESLQSMASDRKKVSEEKKKKDEEKAPLGKYQVKFGDYYVLTLLPHFPRA